MKIVIIYDSVFGNTQKLAEEMGEVLKGNKVDILKPAQATSSIIEKADVVIVGSPTRAFNPTKEISAFLKSIPAKYLKGKKALAFDTRMNIEEMNSKVFNFFEKVFGYAGENIEKSLMKKGADMLLPHEGFFVKDSEGPLADGELERAKNWVEVLK